MSKLKNQLKDILPKLSYEANRCRNEEVRRRLSLIKAIVGSTKSIVKACASCGISTDAFYEWANRLAKEKKLSALEPHSRRPKRSPYKTRKRIEKRVVAMRHAEPYLGADRISSELKRLFNMVCPPSTVNAILHRFGLITVETKKKLTKRHIKRYRRDLPGYGQLDVKYVPQLINGRRFYQFNFVDHCTTWRFTRTYPYLTHACVGHFLDELEPNCPFPIFEIQTDNGQEFTDKYKNGLLEPSGEHVLDQWCSKRGIRHRLIPIGQKELNGKVENTHKQDDREFYSQYTFSSFAQLRQLLISYNERWNSLRYTKALGRRTPDQAIDWACVRVLAWASIIEERHQVNKNTIINWDRDFNAFIRAPNPEPIKRRPSPRKKKTPVNRYFQYLEWERKKSSS